VTLYDYLRDFQLKHLVRIFSICSIVLLMAAGTINGQPCIPYQGYTTWLGYTNAWSDSSNWCPAVAPVSTNPAMNVRIPGGPSGSYTYHRPLISSGVYALTNKLRIETNDTLHILSNNQSSLTVNDSLKIESSNSALVVSKPVLDTVQLNTGTSNFPNISLLNNRNRSRSFLVFPSSELLAQGLQAGDIVCKILIHVQRKSNGNPYRNLTVKYFYTTNAQGNFGSGFSAVVPFPVGFPALPVTIWQGDLNPADVIPAQNDYGTYELELQTPFLWSGTMNPLVLEFCYDNVGFVSTGANDEPRFTSTTNLNRYLNLQALTTYSKPGCNIMPQDTVTVIGNWGPGSNFITLNSASQAFGILPGMYCYEGGNYVSTVSGTLLVMALPMTTGGVNQTLVFSNVQVVSGNFRPNVTFSLNCNSHAKYPIYISGHWDNNGTFLPGNSRVIFDGVINEQQIGGQSNTTFFDLDISNPNHVIRLSDFTILDSLRLLSGRLKLNRGMMTLSNPLASTITRTNGFLQCEADQPLANLFPFGRIFWKMGYSGGLRTIPFISHAGHYVPMDYQILSGSHHVIIGTYGTLPDNTSLPLPEVTNVIGFNGISYDSSGVMAVDRFYLLKDSLGINPVANVTFRYSNSERAAFNPTGISLMGAQRWINSLDLWEVPLLPGQVYSVGNPDQVNLTIHDSVFSATEWWTISNLSSPLGTGYFENDKATFSIYPNPWDGDEPLYLNLGGLFFSPELVTVRSIEGRLITSGKVHESKFQINLQQELTPGLYLIQISGGLHNVMKKLVVLDR
jgi:hypothetical protein